MNITRCTSRAAAEPRSLPLEPCAASGRINLALQGGGAHGAFTWGVLDRLLEEDKLSLRGRGRDQRRRHERGRACLWPGRRRQARRAEGARQFLAAGQPCRGLQPAAAEPARPADRLALARAFAGLPDVRHGDAADVALPVQSAELQSAEGRARTVDRPRCDPHDALPAQAQHLRHQCAHRQGQGVHQRRIVDRRDHGVGLPAVPVPGGRDRRRGLLGRRLYGQSGDLPADLFLRHARRADRPHQPDRAAGAAARRRWRSSTASTRSASTPR